MSKREEEREGGRGWRERERGRRVRIKVSKELKKNCIKSLTTSLFLRGSTDSACSLRSSLADASLANSSVMAALDLSKIDTKLCEKPITQADEVQQCVYNNYEMTFTTRFISM